MYEALRVLLFPPKVNVIFLESVENRLTHIKASVKITLRFNPPELNWVSLALFSAVRLNITADISIIVRFTEQLSHISKVTLDVFKALLVHIYRRVILEEMHSLQFVCGPCVYYSLSVIDLMYRREHSVRELWICFCPFLHLVRQTLKKVFYKNPHTFYPRKVELMCWVNVVAVRGDMMNVCVCAELRLSGPGAETITLLSQKNTHGAHLHTRKFISAGCPLTCPAFCMCVTFSRIIYSSRDRLGLEAVYDASPSSF